MLPRSAAHTVFATPELAFAISAYLAPRDLTECACVCKQWFQHTEYIMWRDFRPHLRIGTSLPPEARKALIRNLPRIRSVELKCHEYRVLSPLTLRLKPGISARAASRLCTNLRRLKLECYYNVFHLKLPPIVKLLNHNLQLSHLTLPFEALTMDGTMLAAIPKLRRLRHLAFEMLKHCSEDRGPYLGSRTIPLLLRACLPLPELEELLLDFDMVWADMQTVMNEERHTPDLETIIKEATATRFFDNRSARKIKTLSLPTCREGGRNPLPIPLLKSSLLDLETCTIPWFSEDTSPQDVEQIVRERCPRLRHVTCRCHLDDTQDGRFVRAFLQGCSELQSFTSHRFSDEGLSLQLPQRRVIANLISLHANTLENFELTECHWISSKDQQAVLSRCKHLKRFWVEEYNGERWRIRPSKASIHITDVSGGDWVCMGLRELRLTLNRYHTDKYRHLSEQIAQASKSVYTQIGRLDKLEILVLDMDRSRVIYRENGDYAYAWDLTLSKGWLGEMVGLKSLRSVQLYSNFWSKMGQAEVDFMHEHWPLLSEIRLYGDNNVYLQTAVLWRWPSGKRPQL